MEIPIGPLLGRQSAEMTSPAIDVDSVPVFSQDAPIVQQNPDKRAAVVAHLDVHCLVEFAAFEPLNVGQKCFRRAFELQ